MLGDEVDVLLDVSLCHKPFMLGREPEAYLCSLALPRLNLRFPITSTRIVTKTKPGCSCRSRSLTVRMSG